MDDFGWIYPIGIVLRYGGENMLINNYSVRDVVNREISSLFVVRIQKYVCTEYLCNGYLNDTLV